MATTRLLRTSRPFGLRLPSSSSSSSSSSLSATTVRCVNAAGFNGEKMVPGDSERKPIGAVKASMTASEGLVTTEPQINRELQHPASLLTNASRAAVLLLRMAVKSKPRKLNVQMFLERAIIDCRFFTFFAVAGCLLGSVLCFVEGCFIILESYIQYFYTFSQKLNQEHTMQLLIEAIDMFLVGTAMLMLGMGLYVMFVGTRSLKEKDTWLSGSNLFGLFHMKTLPAWIGMQSVSQAKSKIGHAVMMILQVGVLEKIKGVPLASGVDLACFAGAVLISSASVFLLSRLSVGSTKGDR